LKEQRMQQPGPLTRARLKALRATAIVGIFFSVLLTTMLVTISKTIRRE
jgi:hypothetical protein